MLVQNSIKNELHDIISGKNKVRYGENIQAIAGYLENSSKTSRKTSNTKQIRAEENSKLKDYIRINNLWINNIDFNQYVSEGAEQRVYLSDSKHVIKLNDAIYYSSWRDYFHNLLLHNYFFSDTAYELCGFFEEENNLYAVVKQVFVRSTQITEIWQIKEFLQSNGFSIIRNNDYLNSELGIILEDLHDENVLTQDGVLYFIDTVFYLNEQFWK